MGKRLRGLARMEIWHEGWTLEKQLNELSFCYPQKWLSIFPQTWLNDKSLSKIIQFHWVGTIWTFSKISFEAKRQILGEMWLTKLGAQGVSHSVGIMITKQSEKQFRKIALQNS